MIPDPFRTPSRDSVSSFEVLAILCHRLAASTHFSDLEIIFRRRRSVLSRIIKELVMYLYRIWSFTLRFSPEWLAPSRLEYFAAAVNAAGAPIGDVWAFIDATIRLISRPTYNQEISYNGYQHDHAMKFQGVTSPDGIIQDLFGPMEERRADGHILDRSGLEEKCLEYTKAMDGRQLFLYGDPAYPMGYKIISGIKQLKKQTDALRDFNIMMSKFRESVEWSFGKATQLWSFLDYKLNQRLYFSPVGTYYIVAVILTNAHTCLYGSQTSLYFNTPPPSLYKYFT